MSTPDLHARAARFFLLAEQASRFKWWWLRTMFWETSVSSAVETLTHLPALAAAVRGEEYPNCLLELALYPLPGVLPQKAPGWYESLVAAWEVHRASDDPWNHNPARLALVRLDGCGMPDGVERPSRLPEWLEEARQITVITRRVPQTTLMALAAWRPAPDVITAPETLRDWVAFWQEMRQSGNPILKGIAVRALLNLPEADLRAASIQPVPPEQLLHELATAIPAAAERIARNKDYNYLFLLNWQPVEGNTWPAAGVAEVARVWLEVTSHNDWRCRRMAWQQLIRWDRTGILTPCGMDLLPFLVSAAQTEKDRDVLWEMARWMPAAEVFTGTGKPEGLNLLQQLETAWQRHRQSDDWLVRASAWLAGIRLHQAGLATESPESFLEAYLAAVAQERHVDTLFVLAQWWPEPGAPPTVHRKWGQVWRIRLEDGDEKIRQAAAFALLRQAVENGTGQVMRHAALEVWRTGTKTAVVTHRLGSVPSRLHEVRAHLAAGRVPDFEAAPTPPAQRQYPRLALPPGHIADREWGIENEKLRIEN